MFAAAENGDQIGCGRRSARDGNGGQGVPAVVVAVTSGGRREVVGESIFGRTGVDEVAFWSIEDFHGIHETGEKPDTGDVRRFEVRMCMNEEKELQREM